MLILWMMTRVGELWTVTPGGRQRRCQRQHSQQTRSVTEPSFSLLLSCPSPPGAYSVYSETSNSGGPGTHRPSFWDEGSVQTHVPATARLTRQGEVAVWGWGDKM